MLEKSGKEGEDNVSQINLQPIPNPWWHKTQNNQGKIHALSYPALWSRSRQI